MNRSRIPSCLVVFCVPFALLAIPVQAATLEGRVYEGDVGNESQPLSGVTVALYGSNNSGQLGNLIISTTTDSQGWYGLEVREGYEYYNIVETDPPGFSSVGSTSVGGTVVGSNQIEYPYPLSGKTLTGNKFWDKSPTPRNNPPVANAGPDQMANAGSVVHLNGSGSSDMDGDPLTYSWSLISVPVGSSAVLDNLTVVQPKFTADRSGTYVAQLVVNDGKVDSSPDTVVVIATSETPRTGTISGNKFNDLNGDGIWNATETGLAGWTIFADMNPWNAKLDPGEPSTVTGPDGSYSLTGLAPGIYNVYEVAQAGWQVTCPSSGFYGITIAGNDLWDGRLFGNHQEGGATGNRYNLQSLCLVLDLDFPGIGRSSVTVTGSGVVEVTPEGSAPGAAMDDNGNGRDDLDTQLVSLSLTGMDPLYGVVRIGLNPALASKGQLEEQVNITPGIMDLKPFAPTGQADSFFDVFFEVELTNLGVTMRTNQAKRIQGILDQLPATHPVYGEPLQTTVPLLRHPGGAQIGSLGPLTSCQAGLRDDFGDAPDTYKTLKASGGAYHKAGPLTLGASVDIEADGHPGPDATGDDLADKDDEDGLVSSLNLTTGKIATVSLTVANGNASSESGMVAGWIDFDGNGQFDLVSDDIGTQYVSIPGGGQSTVQFTFLVPPGAKAGKTYARFRLYRDDPDPMAIPWAILPTDAADYGEVEDYVATIRSGISPDDRDYGDAPLPYPSADHPLGGPYLGHFGDLPDRDTGMQRDAAALGDDNDADGDDENGLLSINLVKNSGVISHAEMKMWTSSSGALTGAIWIDWNADGDWDDPGELMGSAGLSVTPVPPGGAWIHVLWGFQVPAIAKPGNTFARLRVYEGMNVPLSPKGAGAAGEVEDHLVQIKADGPGLPPGGIVHGYKWDDQDGDSAWDVAEPGLAGWQIWLDLNGNGAEDAGDRYETTDGNGYFRFTGVPAGTYLVGEKAQSGWTQTCPAAPGTYTETVTPGSASFPLVFGNTTRPVLPPPDKGKLDWGDAPDPTYPTLRASNGDYHVILPGFQLGGAIDPELDGQPSAWALGDDATDAADEDGVLFQTPILPGQIAKIQIVASAPGKVDAWIDFDVDGTWTQASDQILTAQAVNAGSNVLNVSVPASAKKGVATFARFRLSTQGGLSSNGPGLDGEVEDYRILLGDSGPYDPNAPGFRPPHLKWSQPPIEIDPNPDPNSGPPVFCGWDQSSKSTVLGDQRRIWQIALDDFHCLGPIPITRIHWWGSYKAWDKLDLPAVLPETWQITFWTNRPEKVDARPFPERLARRLDVPAGRVRVQPVGLDQFLQRTTETCFMYELALEPSEWFRQADFPSEQDIYWIGITAVYAQGAEERSHWGWTTRPETWRDPAQIIVLYGDGPNADTTLFPGGLSPVTSDTLCGIGRGNDMAFELLTEEPWVKWDLPMPDLRDWPYATDQPAIAIEDSKGQVQVLTRVADDWVCRSPEEPVIALAWYGSYRGFGYRACACTETIKPRRPDSFLISIWTNAHADGTSTYTRPGRIVWEYKATTFDEVMVGYDGTPPESPNEPVFRYTVRLPEPQWFWQEKADQVYWLSLVAVYKDPVDRIAYPWGWTDRPYGAGGIASAIEYDLGEEPRWRIIRAPLVGGVDMSFTLYTRPPGP